MQVAAVLSSCALAQGCAGYAPIEGCGTVPPGKPYAKLSTFILQHYTERKTLKKALQVNHDDKDGEEEAKRALVKMLEGVHSIVNQCRAFVLRVAYPAMTVRFASCRFTGYIRKDRAMDQSGEFVEFYGVYQAKRVVAMTSGMCARSRKAPGPARQRMSRK